MVRERRYDGGAIQLLSKKKSVLPIVRSNVGYYVV
jgi:hypothetical protein